MFQKVKQRMTELAHFSQNVVKDPRIPGHDRTILVAMVTLIISPIDLIPDWIPILGQMDDFVILALILDYFFGVLDEEVVLSHYPWSLASFVRLKRGVRLISAFAPRFIKRRLWKYTGSPYR